MKTFEQLGLKKNLIQAIRKAKFQNPNKIQEKTINIEENLIIKAPTGSGKTLAYLINILKTINPKGDLQAIILVPTRELALQVKKVLIPIADNLDISFSMFIGGQRFDYDNRYLQKRNQIIIATPGRIIKYINQKRIKLNVLRNLVIDEIDEMIDMGFIQDVIYILSRIPGDARIIVASATMSKKSVDIINEIIHLPVMIEQKQEQETVEELFAGIQNEEQRKEELVQILKKHKPKKALIFVNTKGDADSVAHELNTQCLHGDKNMQERKTLMTLFEKNKIKFLVATDLASRGLDFRDIELIINYKLPKKVETYNHRRGRTARHGNNGKMISIINTTNEAEVEIAEQVQN